ncbi:ABC transporter permease [Clostridium sp.]|uniref:ABC transporter permease n=1 Tax=Clostridium sp. TaxID=1506 RepID=UPI0028FF55CC|nr:ABC transporter permease [Clostridium sp.]MDU2157091.1 ABC transporter permease [Clostridium sp.]
MVKFIIKKILGLIPMLLLITFIIYLGLELTPGDAVSHMISPELLSNMDPAKLDEIRAAYGLNDPFILRYFRWLGEILRGNFGYSVSSGVPIINIIKDLLPATLELAIAALLISTILGSLLGLFSAIRRGTFSENLLTVAGMIGVSIPQFFFGMVCILIFSLNLGWLPVGGRMMPGKTAFIDRYEYLILPALVLGISLTAGVMRYARSSMLDTMNKEYIRTARSKGLPEWRVNLVHGSRVALTPVIVLIGFRLPTLIGGAVVIETIFRWPGIGSAFATAVRAQNYPLVMMIALLTVTAVLVSSFLVDVLTALLDPRVKLD